MGYNLHITRKEDWSDEGDSNEIKLTEWTDYIRSDNEMQLEDKAWATTDNGDEVTYHNNGLAIWTSYSKNGFDDNYAWFDLRGGNVTVKNPDNEIINKMIDIAGRLMPKFKETMEKPTTQKYSQPKSKSRQTNVLGGNSGVR